MLVLTNACLEHLSQANNICLLNYRLEPVNALIGIKHRKAWLLGYLSACNNWALVANYGSNLTGPRTGVKIVFTFFLRQHFNSSFYSHLKDDKK